MRKSEHKSEWFYPCCGIWSMYEPAYSLRHVEWMNNDESETVQAAECPLCSAGWTASDLLNKQPYPTRIIFDPKFGSWFNPAKAIAVHGIPPFQDEREPGDYSVYVTRGRATILRGLYGADVWTDIPTASGARWIMSKGNPTSEEIELVDRLLEVK